MKWVFVPVTTRVCSSWAYPRLCPYKEMGSVCMVGRGYVKMNREEMEKGGYGFLVITVWESQTNPTWTWSTGSRSQYCKLDLTWPVGSIIQTPVAVFNRRTVISMPCMDSFCATVSDRSIYPPRGNVLLDVWQVTVVSEQTVVAFTGNICGCLRKGQTLWVRLSINHGAC